MAYKYCTATNWGKNFFTHEERKNFYLAGHPGDVWVVGDNLFGDQWIGKVNGAIKTKTEAQTIVDGKIAEDLKQYILSKGGTEDPHVLYKRFRGKTATNKALLERAGLL